MGEHVNMFALRNEEKVSSVNIWVGRTRENSKDDSVLSGILKSNCEIAVFALPSRRYLNAAVFRAKFRKFFYTKSIITTVIYIIKGKQ